MNMVGSITNLALGKLAKITNTVKQKSNDGNLRKHKILGKAYQGEKEIRESVSYVKKRDNLD